LLSAALTQSTLIPELGFTQIKPDLVLLVVVARSAVGGLPGGLVWGFFGGLVLDVFSGAPFGSNALAMVLVAFLASFADSGIFRSGIVQPLLLTFVATLLYDLVIMAVLQVTGHEVLWLGTFLRLVLPAAVLNAILMPLFYLLAHWMERRFEFETVR
jgi:rod shape-determining protein MreD